MKHRSHLRWLVPALLVIAFALPAQAAPPVVGVGVGIGEVGTLGATLRIRPADIIGIEGGAGVFYYYITDGGDNTESGFVPAYGGEVILYLTDRQKAGQHGVGFIVQNQEVLGTVGGISYRYERYFGAASRMGFHLDVGFAYAPDGEENAKDFFVEKSDQRIDRDDIDYTFIPISLKVGLQF